LGDLSVNNFRLIFNQYFGTNFELLKDVFFGPDESGHFVSLDNFSD